MSKYTKAAKAAVAAHLDGVAKPVMLFDLTGLADRAAEAAGKKRDLFDSLFDYACLLPSTWTTRWLSVRAGGDSLFYAVPRTWTQGQSESLLLGAGALRETALCDLNI